MAKVPLLQPGAILQVVQNSVDIQATTTGSSYIQTGLKCQITSKTPASKFEVKGTVLLNSRTNSQGMTAKIMVRNVSTSSAWVDFAMAAGCDSHGLGGYTSTETDHWFSSGFTLYGTPGLVYAQNQILEFEVWVRGAGIGNAGSTTSRVGHPGRTSNMVITEIY